MVNATPCPDFLTWVLVPYRTFLECPLIVQVDYFRVPRYSGTIARNVHESDLWTITVSCVKGYSYLNATIGSMHMADDLLELLILLTNWSEATRTPSAVKDGSSCAFHSVRRACMTSMRAARAAGSHDATTAAASSTNAERTTGKAPGIFTSKK